MLGLDALGLDVSRTYPTECTCPGDAHSRDSEQKLTLLERVLGSADIPGFVTISLHVAFSPPHVLQ